MDARRGKVEVKEGSRMESVVVPGFIFPVIGTPIR